jgi:spermidine synthase
VRRSGLILAIFVLSGAAGLVYEVVWSRQLVLVFGNTTQAVATILTGFFGGMAIGSFVGGRIADRVRSPLRLYGLLELILVVVVILTPVTFRLLHEVYRAASRRPRDTADGPRPRPVRARAGRPRAGDDHDGRDAADADPLPHRRPAPVAGLRTALRRQHLRGDPRDDRGRLLPDRAARADRHLLVGAACSGIAGVVALVVDRRRAAAEAWIGARPAADLPEIEELAPMLVGSDEPPAPEPAPGSRARTTRRAHPELAFLVAFVSGLTSLGYQTLWNRLLASGTGNSTYIFSSILAIFLIGLVLGATVYAIVRSRITRPIMFLAIAQLAVVVIVITGLISVIGVPGKLDPSKALDTLWAILRPVLLVVLPATFLMGLSFPASSSLLADDPRRIATYAGRLLAANTTGAIVGTFVIPFFLIPLIGSPASVAVLALVNLGLAAVLVAASTDTSRITRAATSFMAAVLAVGILVNLLSPATTRFVDPSVARINAAGRRCTSRPRTRSPPSRQARQAGSSSG